MADGLSGTREIGTGYVGKEPGEYLVDVVRLLVRAGSRSCTRVVCSAPAVELGFEACLTTRPFTLRIGRGERTGALLPGRGDARGADRVRLDLADALAVLHDAGARYRIDNLGSAVISPHGSASTVLVGPVRVDDRWCPIADRLVTGEAWTYLVAYAKQDEYLVCFDPVAGGFTAVPSTQLAAYGSALIVEPPAHPLDRGAIGRRCLHAGLRARVEAARAPDRAERDGAGWAVLAKDAEQLVSGEAARRLRVSLAAHALGSLRWAGLLGAVGGADVGTLALADLLRDTTLGCQAAHQSILDRDEAVLGDRLRYLASTADAITELCSRALDGEEP